MEITFHDISQQGQHIFDTITLTTADMFGCFFLGAGAPVHTGRSVTNLEIADRKLIFFLTFIRNYVKMVAL